MQSPGGHVGPRGVLPGGIASVDRSGPGLSRGYAARPTPSRNPPDATPAFFDAYQNIVNQAIGGAVRVLRPYAGLHKGAVMHRGRDLPLEWTFSCIRPINGKHCGKCNKCAERRRAFSEAGMMDRTSYHEGIGSRE